MHSFDLWAPHAGEAAFIIRAAQILQLSDTIRLRSANIFQLDF